MKLNPVRSGKLSHLVAEAIQGEILPTIKAGSRLPSVRELAKQLDVSTNTIQAALAVLQRQGSVESWQGSGVYATTHKDRRRIGILSELNLLDHNLSRYYPALAAAVHAKLVEAGHEPCLYIGSEPGGNYSSNDSTCPGFWADAATGRLAGAILLTSKNTSRIASRIEACPIPLVGDQTPYDVTLNRGEMIDTMVRDLAARGCRRLGLLSWHSEDLFRQSIAGHGLRTENAWIRSDLDPSLRGSGWDDLREIWTAAGEKPDGLVILDDMLFLDAQEAIRELGIRVPQDLQLAVTTTRNAYRWSSRLPVTEIEIDPAAVASQLVELLCQRLSSQPIAPAKRQVAFQTIPAPQIAPATHCAT